MLTFHEKHSINYFKKILSSSRYTWAKGRATVNSIFFPAKMYIIGFMTITKAMGTYVAQ